MSRIQEVFNRLQKTKEEQKKVKKMYREALNNSKSYQNATEELKGLREKKKKIEENIKDEFASEFDKLENLKTDIENDALILSDLAVSELARGKAIELKDEKGQDYEPIFKVSFKKIG